MVDPFSRFPPTFPFSVDDLGGWLPLCLAFRPMAKKNLAESFPSNSFAKKEGIKLISFMQNHFPLKLFL